MPFFGLFSQKRQHGFVRCRFQGKPLCQKIWVLPLLSKNRKFIFIITAKKATVLRGIRAKEFEEEIVTSDFASQQQLMA